MSIKDLAERDIDLHKNMTGLAQSLLDDRTMIALSLIEAITVIETLVDLKNVTATPVICQREMHLIRYPEAWDKARKFIKKVNKDEN